MRQEHWEERLVHYQYIEDLLEGQRVLEVGCGSGAGAHYLARRALQVISVDPSASALDNSRYAYSQPNLTFMRTEPANFQLKDNSFDMVLVPELKRFSTWGAFMPELRRVLKPGGTALFAVSNGDRGGAEGMALAEFEEYLSHTFPNIRLMGEIPFSGVTVADFNPDGDASPLLDCSLVPEDEDPSTYVALCSGAPLSSLGYGVLQIPGGETGDEELQLLRAELEQARQQLQKAPRQDRRRRRGRGDEDTGRVADLEARIERESSRADDLEQRLQAERERSDQARDRAEQSAREVLEQQGRAETERVRAEAAQRALGEWQQAAAQHSKRAESAERRCDSLLMRIEQGSADLSRLHQRIAELQGLRQADQWRVDELVGRLREQEERLTAAPAARRETVATPVVDDSRELEQVKELDDARERVEELEAEIVALREHEDSAVGELQKRLSEARERARDAEKKLAEANEQMDQTQEQIQVVDQQVQPLQQQLAASLEEQARLDKELMKSESRVAEHQRKHTNSQARVVQLEVRLKRSESEAATLSKWAEELRDELAATQGKSKAIPVTPEPEVMALRNDLREANARIEPLERRCAELMTKSEQAAAALRDKEQALQEALATADGAQLAELEQLRSEAAEADQQRHRADDAVEELERVEAELRDVEQARSELSGVQQDLEALRGRVQDVDGVSEELEQLRLQALQQQEMATQLAEMEAELAAVRADLRTARAELDLARQDLVAKRTAEVEQASSANDELLQVRERQIEALLEGAALHREEAAAHQNRLAELAALVEELEQEIAELRTRLEQGQQQRDEAMAVRDEMARENSSLSTELARTRGALDRSEAQRQGGAEAVKDPESLTEEDALSLHLEAADRRLGVLDEELSKVDTVNETVDSIGARLQAEVDRLSDIERELEQLSAIKNPRTGESD